MKQTRTKNAAESQPNTSAAPATPPLTWGDVYKFIHLNGLDLDEYFLLDHSIVDREVFFATPVWGEDVHAVPVIWWSVGSNEGFYLWIETIENTPRRMEGRRRHIMTGKFWDVRHVAAAAASLQIYINQFHGLEPGGLRGMQRMVVLTPGQIHPMNGRELEETVYRYADDGDRLLFYSETTKRTYLCVVKGAQNEWTSASNDEHDHIVTTHQPHELPADLVFLGRR